MAMKRIRQAAALLALALIAAARGRAQTISPVIQEYQQKADSRFQIYNDVEIPLTVTLEPYSFSVDSNGSPTFRPLDSGINVQLSATSFRIQPKQTFYVFYKATAEKLPAWFCIYATVTGPTAQNGLKLAFRLPHTVYLLDKKTLERDQIEFTRAETTAEGDQRKIVAEIVNHSAAFGRVKGIEIVTGSGTQSLAGFPLFPGQKRLITLDWKEPGDPRTIVLDFDRFKSQADLRTTAAQTLP
jgi:hypothetical protein